MASPDSSAKISARDNNILDLIFNPEAEFAPNSQPSSKPPPTMKNSIDKERIPEEQLKKLKSLESEGVKFAEDSQPEKAIEKFSECITQWKSYGSAYNNRAQCYRILGKNEVALMDLNAAIEFANDDENILKQAYSQRGIIHKALGNQDQALSDFQMGARYGNEIAKMASVKENPYAKLCGSVVQEVMSNLRK